MWQGLVDCVVWLHGVGLMTHGHAGRHYYSWVLAMLISQHGQLLHTFPRTIFEVRNFTTSGYSCMPDKVPIDRRISYPLASNLYKVRAPALLLNLALLRF